MEMPSVLILFYYFPTEFVRAISMIIRNSGFFHFGVRGSRGRDESPESRRVRVSLSLSLSQMHLDVVFRERIRAMTRTTIVAIIRPARYRIASVPPTEASHPMHIRVIYFDSIKRRGNRFIVICDPFSSRAKCLAFTARIIFV